MQTLFNTLFLVFNILVVLHIFVSAFIWNKERSLWSNYSQAWKTTFRLTYRFVVPAGQRT